MRGRNVFQPRQHHGKFVTADACQRVVIAQRHAQTFGYRAQQFVTNLVAERVIDVLEVIEIQTQRGGVAVSIAVALQGFTETLAEQNAVRQTGEIVVMRHVVNTGVGGLLVRHVISNHHHVAGLRIVPADHRTGGL